MPGVAPADQAAWVKFIKGDKGPNTEFAELWDQAVKERQLMTVPEKYRPSPPTTSVASRNCVRWYARSAVRRALGAAAAAMRLPWTARGPKGPQVRVAGGGWACAPNIVSIG